MLTTRTTGMPLISVLSKVGRILQGHNFASVRAGVEMALINAVANMIGMPLWRVFGGVSNTISTDITIPTASPAQAHQLASDYCSKGFQTLKLKVESNLVSDIEMLRAVRGGHPECSLILDANGRYSSSEALQLLQILHELKLSPVLFEQPVHRNDWDGLGWVTKIAKEKYGVSVAADEKIWHVINIKLAKLGVLGSVETAELAQASGLELMIGGMAESRLAVGFAGHLAAGPGCFKYIDLDSPFHLLEDPVLKRTFHMKGTYTNPKFHNFTLGTADSRESLSEKSTRYQNLIYHLLNFLI
ncbi:hypothetical protein DCAR_0312874 [Daucus carota subsp. sativus]|uniref:Mandelate racemase/muconate lactonizing enzyme C-terminal domain-containing protein n=1 Tax=Daucus carota subsp. sativus TaxID=79200 RepID=A0AAF0WSB5_DAUCS|nr:hypothetical protein DCAR_0312874 [Daucus carota subsp. sativus]